MIGVRYVLYGNRQHLYVMTVNTDLVTRRDSEPRENTFYSPSVSLTLPVVPRKPRRIRHNTLLRLRHMVSSLFKSNPVFLLQRKNR